MFVPSKEPIALSEACLLGLCPSLNAPVVQNDELSPGPARAAIVTFAEEYGDLALAVAIRALESGRVVVYRCRESLGDAEDVARTMEAALTFAEGLGFLFDDDMIDGASGAGRSSALEHWNRLTGDGEVFTTAGVVDPPPPPISELTLPGEGLDGPMEDLLAPEAVTPPAAARRAANGGAAESPVLLLDDLMEVVEETPGEELLLEPEPDIAAERALPGVPDEEPAGQTVTLVPPDDAVPLTKFRRSAPRVDASPKQQSARPLPPATQRPRRAAMAEATKPDLGEASARPTPSAIEAETASGPAALGRIPIVRRRREPESGGRPSLLARILASF